MTKHNYKGYRPPPANHPLLMAARMASPAFRITLPDIVDLTPNFAGIRDQGAEGSCSGFATAELREILWATQNSATLGCRLSPAYLYARTRLVEGTFPEDAGASLADELAVLHAYGVAPETDMPYDADPAKYPTAMADVSAHTYRVKSPCRVDFSAPPKVKQVLAAGMPIGIGIKVYQSFEDVGSDGILPLPDTKKEAMLGGHALCVCGYDAKRSLYRVINSWGTDWGDKGYCWMPMNYPGVLEALTAVK